MRVNGNKKEFRVRLDDGKWLDNIVADLLSLGSWER